MPPAVENFKKHNAVRHSQLHKDSHGDVSSAIEPMPSPNHDSSDVRRDEYVEYLEQKLETIMNACLELNSFSDRLSLLERQAQSTCTSRTSTSLPVDQAQTGYNAEINVLKNRILLLEEKLNRQKQKDGANDCITAIESRIADVEETCMRLADDSMGAIQSIHSDIASLETKTASIYDAKLSDLESRMSQKISDGIEQVTVILRKLIACQKLLYYRVDETRANTPVVGFPHPKTVAIQELYREIEYNIQKNRKSSH